MMTVFIMCIGTVCVFVYTIYPIVVLYSQNNCLFRQAIACDNLFIVYFHTNEILMKI